MAVAKGTATSVSQQSGRYRCSSAVIVVLPVDALLISESSYAGTAERARVRRRPLSIAAVRASVARAEAISVHQRHQRHLRRLF
jgi:hypothetical protein